MYPVNKHIQHNITSIINLNILEIVILFVFKPFFPSTCSEADDIIFYDRC